LHFIPPKIYPITDERISGLSHAEQTKRLIAGGATLIQLREKHASPQVFYEEAAKAVEIANAHNVSIVINDRVDVALALRTGVHLGQDDLAPTHARALLGPEALIGFSTHSLEQVRLAMSLPVDYIAIGPIFSTRSKTNPDPVIGLKGLREISLIVTDLPLVAIGGINETNLPSVLDEGAGSAAMIGTIISNPERITEQMQMLIAVTNTR
jgi:thiamine-phosphate pyrophosphorylase